MSNLQAFMIEKKEEFFEYVASKRFINQETGKPEVWKLKTITAKENEDLRKQCYKQVIVQNGKKKGYQQQLDTIKYLQLLTDKCVVYPDLHNAELLDFYHEMDSIDLLTKHLLNAAEYDDLTAEIQRINGYDLEEAVEEAKN